MVFLNSFNFPGDFKITLALFGRLVFSLEVFQLALLLDNCYSENLREVLSYWYFLTNVGNCQNSCP